MQETIHSPLIIQSLPNRGLQGILYLLDQHNGSYEEYLWINNKWECYGITNIDMSIYYLKEETDAIIDALDFVGTPEEWNALTPEEQSAYLVAKVKEGTN